MQISSGDEGGQFLCPILPESSGFLHQFQAITRRTRKLGKPLHLTAVVKSRDILRCHRSYDKLRNPRQELHCGRVQHGKAKACVLCKIHYLTIIKLGFLKTKQEYLCSV
jgi:hypothetical protein